MINKIKSYINYFSLPKKDKIYFKIVEYVNAQTQGSSSRSSITAEYSLELKSLIDKYHKAVSAEQRLISSQIAKKFLNSEEQHLLYETTAHIGLVQFFEKSPLYLDLSRRKNLSKEDFLMFFKEKFEYDTLVYSHNMKMIKDTSLTSKDFIYNWESFIAVGKERPRVVCNNYETFSLGL